MVFMTALQRQAGQAPLWLRQDRQSRADSRQPAFAALLCAICVNALPGSAQQTAAPAEASAGPPSKYALQVPVSLAGNEFVLHNPLGIAFADQPVEVLLAQPTPEGTNLVLDEAGKTVGQVERDRHHLSLRAGFADDQKERRFHLAKGAATAPAGLEHPVSLRTATWTAAQTKAAGTTHSNGIASYYEISNGWCGVRVPATVRPDALPGMAAGVSTFHFNGHDWLKLYPGSYAKTGVTDVGPLVDTEVHVVDAAPAEAVVGHWRVSDGSNAFAEEDQRLDDRQYLRVKFNGTEHITVFTPFFRGKRPADLKVTARGPQEVTVSYTNAHKVKRVIVITPQGYRIESNGKVTERATFTDKLPAKLYPQWKDVDYPGPDKP